MKTLLILRHAKSSWKEAGLSDHERPLNKRGRRDAPKIGRLLREKELALQLIVCSDAKRVRETVELVTDACGYEGGIDYKEELYAAEPEAYIDALKELDDTVQCVMVVGHNPGLEELLENLVKKEHVLSTAALAKVSLPIQRWQELDASVDGDLIDIWVPRQLTE